MDEAVRWPDQWILLVDDVGSYLEVLQRILRRRGCKRVRTAESITDAEAVMQEISVDLLVSDWRVPDGDGLAFLRRVRATHPSTRCILLTGWTESLRPEQREELDSSQIEVYNKLQASTANDLIGLMRGGEVHRAERHSPNDGTTAHIIAEQSLRLETMDEHIREARRLNQKIIQTLMEELDSLPCSPTREIVHGSGPRTVADLRTAIEDLTPEGIEIIELYQEVVRRMFLRTKRK